MKTIRISLVLVFFSFIAMNAQVGLDLDLNDLVSELQRSGMYNTKGATIDLKTVKGSPYLEKDFQQGLVYDSLSEQKMVAGMRYNIYNDQIEIIGTKDSSISAVLKKESLVCVIGNKTFRYFSIASAKAHEAGYFEVVISNDKSLSLLAKYNSIFIEAKPAPTPLQQPSKAKFITHVSYFIIQNGTLMKLPSKKKKVLDLFADKKKVMKAYMKENRTKLKKRKDLEILIRFYNTL